MQPGDRAEVAPAAAHRLGNPAVWVTTGDPLDERIKFGDDSSLAERIALALQLARLIHAEHQRGRTFGGILSSDIYVGDKFRISVGHRPRTEHATAADDIRSFGFLLYEILAARLLTEEERARLPNLQYLYRMGVQETLVDSIAACIQGGVAGLAPIIATLETVLAACLGEPARRQSRIPRSSKIAVATLLVLFAVALLARYWI